MKRALLCLMLAACSFDEPLGSTVNLCSANTECGDASCVEGRCIVERIDPALVVLEVVPTSPGDERPSWNTRPFELVGPAERNLELPGSIELRGIVRFGEERVSAEVVLQRRGLPGQSASIVRTNTFPEPRTDSEGAEYDFAVLLEGGQTYDVEVRPAGIERAPDQPWFRSLPPLRIEGELTTPDAIPGAPTAIWRAAFPFDTTLDEGCGAERRDGCTLRGSVVRMADEMAIPEAGLQVRAVDEEGRIVSSTALTDEQGAFSLVVAASTGEYTLRVGGASGRELFPVIDADPQLLDEDVRIRVPEIAPVTYEGLVETSDGDPMAASIEFASTDVIDSDAGIVGAYRTTEVTLEDGTFSVQLLPGTYEITITPSNLDFALLNTSVHIIAPFTGNVRGQLFSVPRRALLGGSVLARDEEVEGLSVQARSLEAGQRTSETVTDETGRFALPLDIGTYDLLMRPPVQSGFPWLVVTDLSVGAVDTTVSARYVLHAPVPITGTVVGAATGLEVRAFMQVGERFVNIGSARVDDNGHYELLLPSALAR